MNNMDLGFIILRHVNSEKSDRYWKLCYSSLREHYPDNKVLIIDDYSNYDLIDIDFQNKLENTEIIKSEYKGRAELLPYLYFLKHKHCDCVCIIHDSVFINKKIDLYTDTFSYLWDFEHPWDQPLDELQILASLDNNDELLELHHNKNLWKGCFGAMTVVNYDYLKKIDDIHNLSNMIDVVVNRYNRMSFERVIAVILENYGERKVVLGNIHQYCKWGVPFERKESLKHLPFIKIWSTRGN